MLIGGELKSLTYILYIGIRMTKQKFFVDHPIFSCQSAEEYGQLLIRAGLKSVADWRRIEIIAVYLGIRMTQQKFFVDHPLISSQSAEDYDQLLIRRGLKSVADWTRIKIIAVYLGIRIMKQKQRIEISC